MAVCDCNIDDIARQCGKNAGGVKPSLHITCVDEVASIGASTDHAVSTITMRAADAPITKGYFRVWNTSRKDSDFKSTQNPDTGVWETEFKYFLPKQTAAKAAILNEVGEDNDIALPVDMNGLRRIVGEIDNPCDIKVEEVTSPKNGYFVTGRWQSSHSPYVFTGTPDVTP